MAVIPFGLIGVILGHRVLGVALSSESFIRLFGLAGVVVNDSLVMIDFIDQEFEEGLPARGAIIEGAKGRFRPIMLTSLTTFLGFTPLILEDAVQAQFFVPFSASVGCGSLFIHHGHPDVPGARAVLGPVAVDRAAGRGAHGHREGDPVAAGAISPP